MTYTKSYQIIELFTKTLKNVLIVLFYRAVNKNPVKFLQRD